ncbi:hypothetical protein HPB50_010738 [Hyalomma asiaticum]|uniref:Uncharacterized protein n=1 Tax=Hyalomma asiaticum TaxID=266040 RepID=A0ACB7T6L9_HYAAI|nr:hypothetical protein HPB50_010738 [Hyalomma asiaticum]
MAWVSRERGSGARDQDADSRNVARTINGCVNVVACVSSCVTSGGSSGIDMPTEMDRVNVPEQLLQQLLGQTNGSAIQREQVAAAVRQRLLTAEPMPAGAMTAAAAIQPAIDCAPRPSGSQPPRFAGFRDAQSPEEFLDRLETFCLVTGVAAEKRLTHVVPATLEGSAKLWLRFVKTFASWEDFKAAFIAEFSSIDAKRRLKQELELRTQHPEENLKEFIYTIAAYYDRIGGEVPEAEKVDRVLRQMHPQLQDLVEGKQFANLAELAKAADGLMERYWRRFQYKPPPPPTDQVARDLAFRPAANEAGLSGAQPRVMAAAAAPFQHPSAASYWPLHPAAIQPSYHRDQLHRSPASAIRPHFPTPPPQGYQPLDGGGITCHRCGGIGHMGRECPSGGRKGPPRCYQCNGIGHIRYQCPGNGRR